MKCMEFKHFILCLSGYLHMKKYLSEGFMCQCLCRLFYAVLVKNTEVWNTVKYWHTVSNTV
jgi:hypothetical protein